MDRIKEPSTWAGLAVLLAQGGKLLFPAWGAVFDGLAMVAGGVAVIKREGGNG